LGLRHVCHSEKDWKKQSIGINNIQGYSKNLPIPKIIVDFF